MDIVDLNKRRSEESEEAQTWTPIDALKDALKKVESGEWPATCVYVAVCWDADGVSENRACVSARSNREAIGMLTQHLVQMAVE